MMLSFETNADASENIQCTIQYPFFKSYNKRHLISFDNFILYLCPTPSTFFRLPPLTRRLDRPNGSNVASGASSSICSICGVWPN